MKIHTAIMLVVLALLGSSCWQQAAAAKSPFLRASADSFDIESSAASTDLQPLLSFSARANSSLRHEADSEVEKPVRGIKTGGRRRSTVADHKIGKMLCGQTVKVGVKSESDVSCPTACPFFVQDKIDDAFCTFVCVQESDCSKWNPATPIGDKEKGICRSCQVAGCSTCKIDGSDTCRQCQRGYRLTPDGQCEFKFLILLYIIGILFAALFIVVVLWVLDLACRPVTNEEGLKTALDYRSRQKIRDSKDGDGDERELYSIYTNMCKMGSSQVAGPGMVLHFNFQLMIMLWSFGVAAGWFFLALGIEIHEQGWPIERPILMWDLFRLGTRPFGMPRNNCIIVAWGFMTQQRLMWTKVTFCYCVYLMSFGLCIIHAIRQMRMFQTMDEKTKTMKDFVALLSDLPPIQGSPDAEECLKEEVQRATKKEVLGVSIAWDYRENEDELNNAIGWELFNREVELELATQQDRDTTCPYNGLRAWLWKKESQLGELCSEPLQTPKKEKQFAELLESLKSTPYAFVVFNTETDRDEAVRSVQKRGFEVNIKGQKKWVTLTKHDSEPGTVQWVNFGDKDSDRNVRLIKGILCIFGAIAFWATFFYAPYAYYVMNFNYDNGAEPSFAVNMVFTLVVASGNAIMYEVCMRVSEYVGFMFKDSKEACYMILYTAACTFNVLLDMVVTYNIAYTISVAQGFRTWDGTKLKEVDGFTNRFETYAIQRMLAENTYDYLFPSTCLLPFLIEPFPTIILPYLLGKWLVRTHPEIVGRDAEAWLASAPMEMGRYADIILDVLIAILIFYFPGGYTAWLFGLMALSHIWIYAFDQWRVLNSIPTCTFASCDIDWWSQVLLAPCVAVILACTVFKANCQAGFQCQSGFLLVFTCTAVGVVHFVVHVLVLLYVVPKFAKPENKLRQAAFASMDRNNDGVVSRNEWEDAQSHQAGAAFAFIDKNGDGVLTRKEYEANAREVDFKAIATQWPCSWFTSNPVHTLRSKYVHTDHPPCGFYEPGKEHTLQINEEIGCFFFEKPLPGEDYS